MARPPNPFPRASLIVVRGLYRVVWRLGTTKFEAATGLPLDRRDEARLLLAAVNAVLAAGGTAFPSPLHHAPAVSRYLDALHRRRNSAAPGSPGPDEPDAQLLAAYAQNLAALSPDWQARSLHRLRDLARHAGVPLRRTERRHAVAWLDAIQSSNATRNRARAVGSRWGAWMVDTGRAALNPFAGIKGAREVHHAADIVHCSPAERKAILAAARALSTAAHHAVALAFYAGLRRAEVFGLAWADVDLERRRLVVRRSKTGHRRVMPLAADLAALLAKTPSKKRTGWVVDRGTFTWGHVERIVVMDGVREKLGLPRIGRYAKRKSPDDRPGEGKGYPVTGETKGADDAGPRRPGGPAGKGAPEGNGAKPKVEERLVRWNVWRHTFGSLLAQQGVGIDKICAWMGNTPEVCRRHYAQFLPKDAHDDDIDKL